ncbi:MAG TPA: OmpA family protein [Stellaceae bacterium]|nr:OmpA family protein [Stellaceae bacterium]
MTRLSYRLAWLATTSLVLAACAGQTSPAVDQARSNYERAAQDTNIAANAPEELRQAKADIDRMDYAVAKDRSDAEIETRAYVANQQVEIAREVADYKQTAESVDRIRASRTETVLSARNRQLEEALADLKARKTDRGVVITMDNVLFKTNQATLAPGAEPTVARLADYLKANPKETVHIEGHTDSTGSPDRNLVLSQARANAVRAALIADGVRGDRIIAQGVGEAGPVADNTTPEGRQMNRRVEVLLEGASATGSSTAPSTRQ